jgi:hypothetical protein
MMPRNARHVACKAGESSKDSDELPLPILAVPTGSRRVHLGNSNTYLCTSVFVSVSREYHSVLTFGRRISLLETHHIAIVVH